MVSALLMVWLLEHTVAPPVKTADKRHLVPIMNIPRQSMHNHKDAAWLFDACGVDAHALLFSDEVHPSLNWIHFVPAPKWNSFLCTVSVLGTRNNCRFFSSLQYVNFFQILWNLTAPQRKGVIWIEKQRGRQMCVWNREEKKRSLCRILMEHFFGVFYPLFLLVSVWQFSSFLLSFCWVHQYGCFQASCYHLLFLLGASVRLFSSFKLHWIHNFSVQVELQKLMEAGRIRTQDIGQDLLVMKNEVKNLHNFFGFHLCVKCQVAYYGVSGTVFLHKI